MSLASVPIELPSVAAATLPAVYIEARAALAKCWRVDECKDWADKAQAMASYARQSKDEGLYKVALRIQARAIRRCGELYKEIAPSVGGSPTHATNAADGTSRQKAAAEAGLSARQANTALRLASVPESDFESQVESGTPPTVSSLAEQGTRKRPAPLVDLEGILPEDFQVATYAFGAVDEFCRRTEGLDVNQAVRGLKSREKVAACSNIAIAKSRLIALEAELCTPTKI